MSRRGASGHKYEMKSFQDQLQQSPYRNTTLADRLVAYFQVLRTHWSSLWTIKSRRRYRRARFERFRLQRAFVDKTINELLVKVTPPGATLLWGEARRAPRPVASTGYAVVESKDQ